MNLGKFWDKIEKNSPNSCWIWTGGKSNGYGQFNVGGKTMYAHRLSYEIHSKNSIPVGLFVCHSCDNPSCVNPKHLWLGTQKDNMDDKDKKGHGNQAEKHGMSKLTLRMVSEIRKLYASGEYTQATLGKMFSVGQDNISYVINNKTWKYA